MKAPTTKKPAPKKPKTITWAEVTRLAFCNSDRLPQRVVIDGKVRQWVGIGWMSLNEKPLPTDVVVIP